MLEINDENLKGYLKININGRIDGITSNDLNKHIVDLIEAGNRNIILDFSNVIYISSIGLRVLIVNQQKLKSINGDLIIFGLTPAIKEILKMSGLLKILTFVEDLSQLNSTENNNISASKKSYTFDNANYEHIKKTSEKAEIKLVGNFNKIEDSSYEQSDLVVQNAKNVGLSIGFGAIGEDWDSAKSYLGESLTINNSLYFYPAIKKPAVDFMNFAPEFTDLQYSYLQNIQTLGKFSDYVSFDSRNEPIEIQKLLAQIAGLTGLDYFGFAIIAESKGIRGMNLKRIPINENKPNNNKSIFDSENFAEWVNFPIDHHDHHNIIAGAGFYIAKDKNRSQKELTIFGNESTFHLHAAIFEKSLLSYNIENFDDELNKIFAEFIPTKVQHILSNSLFSIGNLAIVGLEG
ncbi:MAG TPA: STAS domain-containing protein [Candidatus Kapabacteria bacterium]|nr:STAS domain-containing protein [Candidatus Kapabacteria bacterium]